MQASDGVWAEPIEDKQFPRLRPNKPEHQVSIWAQAELSPSLIPDPQKSKKMVSKL